MLRCLKFHARFIACALLLVASCEQEEAPAEQPLAHVTALSGNVTVRPGGHQASAAAKKDSPLYIEDIVTTGADGKATLTFEGGNSVELQANTSMVLRKGGGAQAALGPILLTGSMRAASGGHGVRLSIGTPFGQAELGGTTVSVLDVSVERGLTVEVGTVDVVTKDGKSAAIKAGQSLAVDGVTITTGQQAIEGLSINAEKAKPPAEIVLTPVVVTLLGPGKAVEVLGAGEKNWKLAKKRVNLKSGDQIRVKKGGNARLQMGANGAVNMRQDSVIAFKDAGESATSSAASYALKSGSTQVLLNKADGKDVSHTVQLGGITAVVTPTLNEADVDMIQGKDGATIIIHSGQVRIGDNAPVLAGMAVDLKAGKVVNTRPLATSKIELRAKSSVVLYYNKRIPPVMFVVPSSAEKTPVKLEIASDKEFKQGVFADMVGGNLVYDKLTAGKYYWRLNGASDTRAVVQVSEESSTDCANCKRTNLIDDTGEKTVVYFQQALPSIVLRWKENPAAAHYNLKVFSDGEFDTPLVNEKVTENKRAFDSGRFEEGKYYWLVTALDKGGNETGSGRMNSLQISYDNVITALVIRSPKDGARVSGGHVPVTGEVELGAKLFINQKRVELDENNRFSESVDVQKGENQIVFRAVANDGVERYYLRNVFK